MRCPMSRGGCGATLQWHEGAFCDACMKKAEEKIRRKKRAEAKCCEPCPERGDGDPVECAKWCAEVQQKS